MTPSAGHEVRRINLYEMPAEASQGVFAPLLSAEEREGYFLENNQPQLRNDPHVKYSVESLRWCDSLVLVYPTWWFNIPAILKVLSDQRLRRVGACKSVVDVDVDDMRARDRGGVKGNQHLYRYHSTTTMYIFITAPPLFSLFLSFPPFPPSLSSLSSLPPSLPPSLRTRSSDTHTNRCTHVQGFFDRCFVPGVGFRYNKELGKRETGLQNIQQVGVVTTYGFSQAQVAVSGDAGRRMISGGVCVCVCVLQCLCLPVCLPV